MKLRNENQSGFTLVELMVSLLVLGIISAIAVPLIGNTMENSDEELDELSIEMIEASGDLAYKDRFQSKDIDETSTEYTIPELMEWGYLELSDDARNKLAGNDESQLYAEGNFVGLQSDGKFKYNTEGIEGSTVAGNTVSICDNHPKLATDDDFSGSMNGSFKYTGSDTEVCIPHVIKDEDVTSYNDMFKGTDVDTVISDNKNVTDMFRMFRSSQATSLNLSVFDTSNVTDMYAMFRDSQATSLDLSSFDTSKVSRMEYMFNRSEATSITLSDSFKTSNVRDMYRMFRYSKATSLDLSSFDTSNVIDMYEMFRGSKATSIDLSSFDTSNVRTMHGLFKGSHATSLDLSRFDTSRVYQMTNMFRDTQITSLDLSSFDTSKVMYMGSMFENSQTSSLDLSSFDTSEVMYIADMFNNSKATSGLAKTQADSGSFNTSSGIPNNLEFTVK